MISISSTTGIAETPPPHIISASSPIWLATKQRRLCFYISLVHRRLSGSQPAGRRRGKEQRHLSYHTSGAHHHLSGWQQAGRRRGGCCAGPIAPPAIRCRASTCSASAESTYIYISIYIYIYIYRCTRVHHHTCPRYWAPHSCEASQPVRAASATRSHIEGSQRYSVAHCPAPRAVRAASLTHTHIYTYT